MSKVIVVKGGSKKGSRIDYISKTGLSKEEKKEGTQRLLFSENGILERKDARKLIEKNNLNEKDSFSEIIISPDNDSYKKLGLTEKERLAAFQTGIINGFKQLEKDLDVKELNFFGGIHRNTSTTHAHIIIKNEVELADGKNKKLNFPNSWFWQNQGESSKLAKFFEKEFENYSGRKRISTLQTKRNPKRSLLLPASEDNKENQETHLRDYAEQNNISPETLQRHLDEQAIYVNKTKDLTFLRRTVEGEVTSYQDRNGQNLSDNEGFFFVGNPQKAKTFVIVDTAEEVLANLELVSHKDLSEVIILSKDGNKVPRALTKLIEEKVGNNETLKIVLGTSAKKENRLIEKDFNNFQKFVDNIQSSSNEVEFFQWHPQEGYGTNWSDQLLFREIPGTIKAVYKKLELDVNEVNEQEIDSIRLDLLEKYGQQEAARKQTLSNDTETLQIEEELFRLEFEKQKETLKSNNSLQEPTENVLEKTKPDSKISPKEITENLKQIPLEDVMPSLGLSLVYDEKRREHVYKGGNYKITVKGNMFYDRYNHEGGKNAINLVMQIDGKNFIEAKNFLFENFGTDYVPDKKIQANKVSVEKEPNKEKTNDKRDFSLYPGNDDKLPIVRDYLITTRRISQEIVDEQIRNGNIFANNFASSVFVQRNFAGEIKGANWRATDSHKRGAFKGSDSKNSWFYLGNIKEAQEFVIVEAAIEAMSYYDLHKDIDLNKTAIISVGTNHIPSSLVEHLESKFGKESTIKIAFNNDSGGNRGYEQFLERTSSARLPFSGEIIREVPESQTDWNDELIFVKENSVKEAENEFLKESLENTRPQPRLETELSQNKPLSQDTSVVLETAEQSEESDSITAENDNQTDNDFYDLEEIRRVPIHLPSILNDLGKAEMFFASDEDFENRKEVHIGLRLEYGGKEIIRIPDRNQKAYKQGKESMEKARLALHKVIKQEWEELEKPTFTKEEALTQGAGTPEKYIAYLLNKTERLMNVQQKVEFSPSLSIQPELGTHQKTLLKQWFENTKEDKYYNPQEVFKKKEFRASGFESQYLSRLLSNNLLETKYEGRQILIKGGNPFRENVTEHFIENLDAKTLARLYKLWGDRDWQSRFEKKEDISQKLIEQASERKVIERAKDILDGIELEFSSAQINLLNNYPDTLDKVGFIVEKSKEDDNTLIVKEIPNYLSFDIEVIRDNLNGLLTVDNLERIKTLRVLENTDQNTFNFEDTSNQEQNSNISYPKEIKQLLVPQQIQGLTKTEKNILRIYEKEVKALGYTQIRKKDSEQIILTSIPNHIKSFASNDIRDELRTVLDDNLLENVRIDLRSSENNEKTNNNSLDTQEEKQEDQTKDKKEANSEINLEESEPTLTLEYPPRNLSENKSNEITSENNNELEPEYKLINEIISLGKDIRSKLNNNEELGNNVKFNALAEKHFKGTRAEGRFDARDAYDALEFGVNLHILDSRSKTDDLSIDEELEFYKTLVQKLPRQTDRTNEQLLFQQFSTPPTLAFVVSKAAQIKKDDVVLEPSAGNGGLAIWGKLQGAKTFVNEITPRRRKILESIGFEKVTKVNAQYLHDKLDLEIKPNVIVMNPPFSAIGGRAKNNTKYGAEHISDALLRLEEGGRLVAIVGEGMALDKPNFTGWWTEIINKYNVRANLHVDGKNYGKYGTNFGNQLLIIDKTGKTPGRTLEEQIKNIKTSSDGTLENVLSMVSPIGLERITKIEAETKEVKNDFQKENEKEEEIFQESLFDLGSKQKAEKPPTEVTSDEPIINQKSSEELKTELEEYLTDSENKILDEKIEELEGLGVITYEPNKLKVGKEHPGDIVESASMGAVTPPDITYTPALDKEIIEEGKLSRLQLESVIYAGQAHERHLKSGERAGYYIGDGTGVGKGRELAAIALDNWNQGRKRVLWLSINYDLVPSAERDFNDLGTKLPLKSLKNHKISTDLDEAVGDGVLFASYATLISESKDGKSRFEQITKWLGDDGVIMFDEGHLAKNAITTGRQKSSQRGEAVLRLQKGDESNDNWRFVYSSATGATDVGNMGYMERLGVWGPGTGFPGGFSEFRNAIENGGVGAMELVARDMKAAGMYSSRSLSYRGVNYRELHHKLSPEQIAIYNLSASAWEKAIEAIDTGFKVTNASIKSRSMTMAQIWGGQQRFYRQLITALKIPTLLQETDRILKEGSEYTDPRTGKTYNLPAKVVISVVGTGESRTKDQISKGLNSGLTLDDLDFSPKQVLLNAIEEQFPTKRFTEETDPFTGKTKLIPIQDEYGRQLISREAELLRDEIISELNEKLVLPDNPLDQIVNYFGENSIAEITGRKKRIIVDEEGNKRYVKRARRGVAIDKASEDDMANFQANRKRVAIISQAASTGISLDSDLRPQLTAKVEDGEITQEQSDELFGMWKNGEDFGKILKKAEEIGFTFYRNVQITHETSWSADIQMQTFGRTHRTSEIVPPEYVLHSTDIAGETRFLSSIAKRLGTLGALTKGDRNQAGGGDISKYNLEDKYGTLATQQIIRDLQADRLDIPEHYQTGMSQNGMSVLKRMGFAKENEYGDLEVTKNVKNIRVNQFLNRMLNLDVQTQNRMFEHFTNSIESLIEFEKQRGLFDEGIQDIKGKNIRIEDDPIKITANSNKASATTYYKVKADIPQPRFTLKDIAERNASADGSTYKNVGFFMQNTKSKHLAYVEQSAMRVNPDTNEFEKFYKIFRPNGDTLLISEMDINQKYKPVKLEDTLLFQKDEVLKASDWWNRKVEQLPKYRESTHHILSGSILPIWNKLKTSEEYKTKNHSSLKTVRIKPDEGERIVGVEISSDEIGRVLRDLNVKQSFATAEEIFSGVKDSKQVVELVGGVSLKPAVFKKQPTIEIIGLSQYQKTEFQNFGVQKEIENFADKYFVSADKEKGIITLENILESYPAVEASESDVNKNALGALAKNGEEKEAFNSLKDKPIEQIWWKMSEKIDEKGQVLLSPASYEITRQMYAKTFGKGQDFEGLFNEPETTYQLLETIDKTAQEKPFFAGSLNNLAKTISNAQDSSELGTVILKRTDEASEHEDTHLSSYVASNGATLIDRHANFETLTDSEEYKKAKPKLEKLTGTNHDGLLVEELFVYSSNGEGDKFGLSPEESKQFVKQWFESFIEKNGSITNKHFKEITDESKQIREDVYQRIASQRVRVELRKWRSESEESLQTKGTGEAGRTDSSVKGWQLGRTFGQENQGQELSQQPLYKLDDDSFNNFDRFKSITDVLELNQTKETIIDVLNDEKTSEEEHQEYSKHLNIIEGEIENKTFAAAVEYDLYLYENKEVELKDHPTELLEYNLYNKELYGEYRNSPFEKDSEYKEIKEILQSRNNLSKEEELASEVADKDSNQILYKDIEESHFEIENTLKFEPPTTNHKGQVFLAQMELKKAIKDKEEFLEQQNEEKHTITIHTDNNTIHTRVLSLDYLENERKVFAKRRLNMYEKTGLLEAEAENKKISLEQAKNESVEYLNKQIIEDQKPWQKALEIKNLEKIQNLDLNIQTKEEALNQLTHKRQPLEDKLTSNTEGEELQSKTTLSVKDIWASQIEAAENGDIESFDKLEELNKELRIPRTNNVVGRLKGLEKLNTLREKSDEKSIKNVESLVVRLSKNERKFFKVSEIKIEKGNDEKSSLIKEARKNLKESQESRKESNRQLLKPITDKINPFHKMNSQLSWITDFEGTLKYQVNPLNTIKDDPGVKLIRHVWNAANENYQAQKLKANAKDKLNQAQSLSDNKSDLTKEDSLADKINQSLKQENYLRKEIGLDLTTSANEFDQPFLGDFKKNLEMPKPSLKTAEIKEIKSIANRIGDKKTVKTYNNFLKNNPNRIKGLSETSEEFSNQAFKNATQALELAENSILDVSELESGDILVTLDKGDLELVNNLIEIAEENVSLATEINENKDFNTRFDVDELNQIGDNLRNLNSASATDLTNFVDEQEKAFENSVQEIYQGTDNPIIDNDFTQKLQNIEVEVPVAPLSDGDDLIIKQNQELLFKEIQDSSTENNESILESENSFEELSQKEREKMDEERNLDDDDLLQNRVEEAEESLLEEELAEAEAEEEAILLM